MTLPTTPQATVLSTQTRRKSIPELMLTSRQEELTPTIQVADLIGHTFISKPDETG
jgi:hypothetical protein